MTAVTSLTPPSRRRPSTVFHMVGLTLVFVAAGMAVAAVVEVIDGGREVPALAGSSAGVAVAGLLLWRATRVPERVSPASIFAAVAWTWIAMALAGSVPYLLADVFAHPDEALFESVSGFTTTGSTVLSPIEGTSRGILFWRQLTQWYGGMGIIVLAVAVLPLVGVGGYELLSAEAPGERADRLAPRISGTAKRLWLVYTVATGLVAAGLLLTGASIYDSVAHALTTLSTGGFSPYNDSIAHFDSLAVELVIIAGMLIGGVSATLHWRFARGDRSAYAGSAELRAFLAIVILAIAAVTLLNVADGIAASRALRDSSFTVVALITTTGYGTADFIQWVPATHIILLFLMASGGMAGSTAGGMKVFRIQVMLRHARRELTRTHMPRAVVPVKLGRSVIEEGIVSRIAGFVLLYIGIAIVATVVLSVLGAELDTAIGSVATTIGNGGPGLGDAGPASNFLVISRPARAVLMGLMLLGRLEVFPILLMFVAASRSISRRRPVLRLPARR